MIITAIKILATITVFVAIFQYFLYATSRKTPMARKRCCMPLGIALFLLAVAGFASRNVYLTFLSVVLVAFSLWLGPTTWRGKSTDDKL